MDRKRKCSGFKVKNMIRAKPALHEPTVPVVDVGGEGNGEVAIAEGGDELVRDVEEGNGTGFVAADVVELAQGLRDETGSTARSDCGKRAQRS